jgi:hypothetical protein
MGYDIYDIFSYYDDADGWGVLMWRSVEIQV